MLGKIYSKFIVRYGDKRAPLVGPLAEKGYLIISDYFNEEDLKQFGEISNVLESGEESVDILNRFPFLSKPVKDERTHQNKQVYKMSRGRQGEPGALPSRVGCGVATL